MIASMGYLVLILISRYCGGDLCSKGLVSSESQWTILCVSRSVNPLVIWSSEISADLFCLPPNTQVSYGSNQAMTYLNIGSEQY